MSKFLTQEQYDNLEAGKCVMVRYIGASRDVVCVVVIDTDGTRGLNPAVFGRTDVSPLTNWPKDIGDGPKNNHVVMKK